MLIIVDGELVVFVILINKIFISDTEKTPGKSQKPESASNIPVKDNSRGKRKRESQTSDGSPSVSPPLKVHSTRSSKENIVEVPKASSSSPGGGRASRGKAKVTPDKPTRASPARTPRRSPGSLKESPLSTTEVTPVRTTRGRSTRATSESPSLKSNSPVTPKRGTPKTPKANNNKTPVSNSIQSSNSRSSRSSSGRTPKSNRKTPQVEETKTSLEEEISKEISDNTKQGRKRKKTKSPTPSPTSSPTADSNPSKVSTPADESPSHNKNQLSPKNGGNRKRRRKGTEDISPEENDAVVDNVTNEDKSCLSESTDVIKPVICEKVDKKSKTKDISGERPCNTLEKKVPVDRQDNVSPKRESIRKLQPSDTCRGAALCHVSSSAEISSSFNHSSHSTNGNSSGFKRRLGDGNDSDPETSDWTAKKAKSEVVITAGDDGDVCSVVPMICVKTLSPCKASVSRSDLSCNINESKYGNQKTSLSLKGSSSPTKNINTSPSKYSSNSASTLSYNKSKDNKSSKCTDSVRTCSEISNKAINVYSSNRALQTTNALKSDKNDASLNNTKLFAASKDQDEEEMAVDLNAAERLLLKFGLNKSQIQEVSNVLTEKLKG